MNAAIIITPAQFVRWFLYICAGITTVAVAAGWVVKGIKKVKQPNEEQNERLTILEKRVTRHDELLDKDKKRMETIEEGSRVTQRAILALLSHGIDGNEVEAMKSAKTELQEYLIKR